MKRPTITDARKLCETLGGRSVVVLVFEGDRVAGVSYGETKAECRSTGHTLDAIVDALQAGRIPSPDVQGALRG